MRQGKREEREDGVRGQVRVGREAGVLGLEEAQLVQEVVRAPLGEKAPPWNLWVHGSSKGTTTCESAGGCPAVQPRYAAGRSVGRIRWLGRLLQHLGR